MESFERPPSSVWPGQLGLPAPKPYVTGRGRKMLELHVKVLILLTVTCHTGMLADSEICRSVQHLI